jgi:hypothetical protein
MMAYGPITEDLYAARDAAGGEVIGRSTLNVEHVGKKLHGPVAGGQAAIDADDRPRSVNDRLDQAGN